MSPNDHDAREAGVLLRGHVWIVATLVPLLDRLLPLRGLLALLTPPKWWRPWRRASVETIVAVVRRRLDRPRNMRRRSCLRMGLVLFHFVRLSGRAAVLHFGVYPPGSDPRRMHGHCWVTLDGQCLSDPPEQPCAEMHTHGG